MVIPVSIILHFTIKQDCKPRKFTFRWYPWRRLPQSSHNVAPYSQHNFHVKRTIESRHSLTPDNAMPSEYDKKAPGVILFRTTDPELTDVFNLKQLEMRER